MQNLDKIGELTFMYDGETFKNVRKLSQAVR